MTLVARVVNVPANPLAIARALAGEPDFSFLWTATGKGPSYVACRAIETSEDLDPEPELSLNATLGHRGSVPRWIGVLPYECRRKLERTFEMRGDARAAPHLVQPLWHRYGAVIRVGRDVTVVGDRADCVEELARLVRREQNPEPISVSPLGAVESDDAHARRIESAVELIHEGEIYVVNIARRFEFAVTGRPVDLVERLAAHARAPYAAALDWLGVALAASSPELLLELDVRRHLVTEPIKGTRPRGIDAREDRRLADELARDPKEIAELTMVVDVERNDLGRVAKTGSVRVRGEPLVRTYGSVHHRLATVVARLREGVSRRSLLESVIPSGSVTGAPKVRAMEVIAELESARRGAYTGGLGYLSHDGAMRLAMVIRTLTISSGVGHYFAGGGIVAESNPEREVTETRWKASQMSRLLQGFQRDA
jgi:anthranilate/para-aminobenzoate synthase component I